MADNKNKPMKEIDWARDGIYLKEYGSKNFITMTEALDISRTKIECVPLHNGGKGGLTFHMTTRDTLDFFKDVLSGEFTRRVLLRKNSQYPDAYQYVGGENGSLHLNFGWAKLNDSDKDVKNNLVAIKYVAIQILTKNQQGKLENMLIAVEMKALRDAARRYMLFTGLTPVTPGSYYESLVKAFKEGHDERSKKYGNKSDNDDSVKEYNRAVQDAEEAAETKTANANKQSVPKPHVERKVSEKIEEKKIPNTNKATEKDSPDSMNQKFVLTVSGPYKRRDAFYIFEAKTAENEKVRLMFRIQALPDWFEAFAKTVETKESPITIIGERKDSFILYKKEC